jgi:hypothetical protein
VAPAGEGGVMVKVLFCTKKGEVWRVGVIVGQYRAINCYRVLMLDTGDHCNVHPNNAIPILARSL